MASPFLALVSEIRALKGHPKVSYPDGDSAYPLVERVLNIKRGSHLPTFGEADPDSGRFPNNKLTDQVELSSDAQWVEVYRKYEVIPGVERTTTRMDDDGSAVTVTTQRVLVANVHTDEALPSGTTWRRRWEGSDGNEYVTTQITESRSATGTAVSTERIDPRMKCKITVTRTLKVASDITASAAKVGSNLVIVAKEERQSSLVATEVVTTIEPPAASSFGTALIETKTMGYKWPARIDISQLDTYGTVIGHHEPEARIIEAKQKTYWVISDTKPTLTFDRIIGRTIWINGVKYTDVLHDPTTRLLGIVPFAFPATTPSNTEYVSSWIGNEKLIDGDVKATQYQLLWEVTGIYVTMQ